MTTRTTTLQNGLRIVTDTVTTVETVALGVWAAVGTRHEQMSQNGVAHMVEHMLFKGTPSMNAQKIAEVIEDVGGNMNAYTGREMTAYYVHLLKEHLDLALEVLADILQNSTMPEDEVERERGVILQEIKMYADSPDQQVFDNFQEAAYPGQALGAPGLGKSDIIAAMRRDTLFDYVKAHYAPSKLVISAAGPIDHDEFVAKVEKLFSNLPNGSKDDFRAANYNPVLSLNEKTTEQSHVVLGFKGIKRLDERYSAMRLLSAILGGGMSSRLFQEVREKRGLVYSIYSFHDAFLDDGLFGIYAGTGPEHLEEMMPVVLGEIKSITDKITEAELARAKAQIKAGMLMARESIMTRCDQQARHMIYFNTPFDASTLVQRIDAVQAKDISDLSAEIFASQPTLAAIGPLGNMMDYETIRQKLAA
ncbi:MAG: peptidase M16 [Micavibrio aeruginosavorus]|uniref:Peptidase M16 n=1 Tax=Micavibrio aeruginosavorus TaxID=349221 RepID=A0A2W5FLX8_9BACT|nr:MAG: peptidase M16 [Micavibrio aeruginosavorus]